MRIPIKWLRDYVDFTQTPEELAHLLTMAGLEVNHVEYLGATWQAIVTAQITQLEEIPGSDHLHAVLVSTGDKEYPVVCGAPNIKLHDKVPLALVGATVEGREITAKPIRGYPSEGMLCSAHELGMGSDHSGIYILAPSTPLGHPLADLLGDAILDLDIKPNRSDCLSIIGISREVAALTGKSHYLQVIDPQESGLPAAELMKLEVSAPDLCPRYTARVITGVKIGPSPHWMTERLIASGLRPINNVVDITNYVMLECGQPLHAFDYDKVVDHTIIVRRALPGEKITTLDGVDRQLTPEMLLITDPKRASAIAGVMGAAISEVDDSTTTILLESANFLPTNIRRTAQTLGHRTDASLRFEKGIDIELTAIAADRAAHLMAKHAGGTIAPGRVDSYPHLRQPRVLTLRADQCEWLLGMPVTEDQIVQSLTALGFDCQVPEETQGAANPTVIITVPSYRLDIHETADLVEEVARMIGYDRIPSTLPKGDLPIPSHGKWFEREELMRDIMTGAGIQEVITYTLTSRQRMMQLLTSPDNMDEARLLAQFPELSPTSVAPVQRVVGIHAPPLPVVRLANPMTSDQDSLRLTLMSGLMEVLRENRKYNSSGLLFYEIGRRYLPQPEGLPDERRSLGVVMSGPATAPAWNDPARPIDFYDLKGLLETLLRGLRIRDFSLTPLRHPAFHPGRAALLMLRPMHSAADEQASTTAINTDEGYIPAGVLGEIHPDVQERYELSNRAYLMELDLERVFSAIPGSLRYQPLIRFPAVKRDLALEVAQEVTAQQVSTVIRQAGGALVRHVALFDVFTGGKIPAGKKSLAFSIQYQDATRSLTDAEIDQLQGKILAQLEQKLGAHLRTEA